MKWFKHDSDASTDAKVKKLLIRHGAIGYAIYFHCIELIAGDISENNITFELEHDSEIIADNLKIKGTSEQSGIEIVETVMRYIIELGLFQDVNGRIFCFKLLKRLDSSMTSNPKFRKIITDAKDNHDLVMTGSCKKRIDKIRKDENRKEDIKTKRFKKPTIEEVSLYCKERNSNIDPEYFWHYYEARDWNNSNGKMKSWKSTVVTWEKNNKDNKKQYDETAPIIKTSKRMFND